MSKPAATAAKSGKMFSADVVAAVLLSTGTTSLTKKHYELMSALDGTKTADGFQHDFRAVIAKSKELKKRVEDGEVFESVKPAKKRGGADSPATPRKRKGSSDEEETPSKKKKAVPKTPTSKKTVPITTPMSKKTAPIKTDNSPFSGAGGFSGFPRDAGAFIRNEEDWEKEFI